MITGKQSRGQTLESRNVGKRSRIENGGYDDALMAARWRSGVV